MSIPKLDPNSIITMWMSTSVNEDRLREDPPIMPADISDEYRREQARDNIMLDARHWDQYRDIVQLSFFTENFHDHFLVCDSVDDSPASRRIETATSIVRVYDSEEAMFRSAINHLQLAMGPELADGSPMHGKILVGWKMLLGVWPVIANRLLRYRIPFYRSMRTNPDTRYSTVRHIADIAAIYLQGAAPSRKAPALPNILKFWGFSQDCKPFPENMAEAVCKDPVGVAGITEKYLEDIFKVLCLYYDVDNTNPQDDPAHRPVQW